LDSYKFEQGTLNLIDAIVCRKFYKTASRKTAINMNIL